MSWLSTPDPNPFTEILRNTPKFVTSRDSSTKLAHPNSTLLAGEAVDTVAELKRSGEGGLVILGSGELVRSLVAAGLVDRFGLTTIPVVLGEGTRLFGDVAIDLEPESSWVSPSGISVCSFATRSAEGR